jgi:hypothetical protein
MRANHNKGDHQSVSASGLGTGDIDASIFPRLLRSRSQLPLCIYSTVVKRIQPDEHQHVVSSKSSVMSAVGYVNHGYISFTPVATVSLSHFFSLSSHRQVSVPSSFTFCDVLRRTYFDHT